MRVWRTEARNEIYRHRILTLWRHRLTAHDERREALVMEAPDWVNMIPITADGRVLLVRQWRFGVGKPTLEIPGGMVEGEDPLAAAQRELLEETGYRARRWRHLGALEPNPAFIANRLTVFAATDLERLGEPAGDGDEEIELETAPLDRIPAMIAEGRIRHALVVAAFYLLAQHRAGAGPAITPAPGD